MERKSGIWAIVLTVTCAAFFLMTSDTSAESDYSWSNKAPEGYVDGPVSSVGKSRLEPPAGYILENEPDCEEDWVDTYNGGCNSEPPVFQPIDCGTVMLGRSGTYLYQQGNYRDTDWFELTVSETSMIRMEGRAGFPVQFFIMQAVSDCNPRRVVRGEADTGELVSIQMQASPGKYWLWAGPAEFVGVDCGSEYWFRASCYPCAVPTLNQWGLMLFITLAGLTAVWFIRRRRRAE